MDRAGGGLHQKVNKRPHSLAGGLESTVAGERQTHHTAAVTDWTESRPFRALGGITRIFVKQNLATLPLS